MKKKTSGTQSVPSIKMKIKKNEAKNVARTKTKIDLLLSTNYVFINIVSHTTHDKKLLEITYDGNDFQLLIFVTFVSFLVWSNTICHANQMS